MKLILQKANNFKEVNKVIEILSTEINDNSSPHFIKENETIIIKYTDTNEQFYIKDIISKTKFNNSSETPILIYSNDLIPLSGSLNVNNFIPTEELYCITRLPIGATDWEFIEDSLHEKSNNIQSITTNPAAGYNFGIQHSAGFSKVGSLVATVDERYASFGLMIGASVGLSESLFRITRNGFTIRALYTGGDFLFAQDTGQLVRQTDFSYTFDTITGRMVISHPNIVCTYGDMVILTPYATTYTIKFISKTSTSATFEWYDSSGNLVRTLGPSMKLYFTRTGTFQCTNEQIANTSANFWIRGIFKK